MVEAYDASDGIVVVVGSPPLVPSWHECLEEGGGMAAAEKAQRAKLASGDVLLAINGERVAAIGEIQRVLGALAAAAVAQGRDSVPLLLRVAPGAASPTFPTPSLHRASQEQPHSSSVGDGQSGQSDQSDVTVGCEEISLKCSVSFKRITRAARGNGCTHRSVFDRWSLDELRKTAHTHQKPFLCPSCKKPIDRIVEVPEINALLRADGPAGPASGVDKLVCRDLPNGATAYEPARAAVASRGGASDGTADRAGAARPYSSFSSADGRATAQHRTDDVEILDVEDFDSPTHAIPEPAHIKKERQKNKRRRIELANAEAKAFDDKVEKQRRAEEGQDEVHDVWAYIGGAGGSGSGAGGGGGRRRRRRRHSAHLRIGVPERQSH